MSLLECTSTEELRRLLKIGDYVWALVHLDLTPEQYERLYVLMTMNGPTAADLEEVQPLVRKLTNEDL